MASYLESHNKSLCSGCTACASICPHKAISMQEDSEGFLFPTIDKDTCVDCGLCQKACPIANDKQSNKGETQKSYIAITDQQKFFLNSATIGVCTISARNFIQAGGKVFGVKLEEKQWKAYHICVSEEDGIEAIRNSKYIQSNPLQTFLEVRDCLKKGIKVLYIGTPCQIAGLKSFLGKAEDNLLTIDLICHGIYSYKLLHKEIEYWEHRLHGRISNFKFRSKKGSGGIINFDLKRVFSNKHYEFDGCYSPTYRCYAYSDDGKNYNLRESCYTCPFRDSSRTGDITVGDAWFIHDAAQRLGKQELKWQNGVSLIIGNTEKGNQHLNLILPLLDYREIPQDAAFVQPALLPTNREIPKERQALYQAIDTKENYAQIVNRLLHVDIEEMYRNNQAKMRNARFKNQLKRILLINRYKRTKAHWQPGWEWWVTNSFLCNFPSKRFRNFMLKKMGITFEGDARIYAGFHIRNPRGIIISKGVSIGPKVLLDGRMGLQIQEGAVIGYGAIIWTLNHDYNDIHFCGKGAKVTIGRHAWVCSNAIILPGITVGEGAIVASGAVVTHDVEPFSIVGGIPAKVIGHREEKAYEYGYDASSDIFHFC